MKTIFRLFGLGLLGLNAWASASVMAEPFLVEGVVKEAGEEAGLSEVTLFFIGEGREDFTDENGEFRIEGVLPGTRVEFFKAGHVTKIETFTEVSKEPLEIVLPKKRNVLPLPQSSNYDKIIRENIILRAADGFAGADQIGAGSEENIMQRFFSGKNGLILIINRILGAVGILYLVIIGIKYMFAQGEEESLTKYKIQMIWLAVGLAIISGAEFIGFSIFDLEKNDLLSEDAVRPLAEKVKQVIAYFRYFVGGIFLFNGILIGYNFITADGEDKLENEKKFLINFFIGAIFLLMAEVIVRVLSLNDGLRGSQYIAIGEAAGIINFILTFMAGACGIMLILASLYYVASFGDEEQTGRAKKIITGCIIGLVISFSSFVIAQFLII